MLIRHAILFVGMLLVRLELNFGYLRTDFDSYKKTATKIWRTRSFSVNNNPKGFGPQKNQKLQKEESTIVEDEDNEQFFNNAEKRARDRLRQMEEEQEKKKQAELDKIQAMREEEAWIRSQPDAGVIPEAVSNRMLQRVLPFIAFPVLMGLGLFYFFIVLARQYEIQVEPSFVAYATQLPFFIGLAGISYGVISASWDPEVEGSALGFEEFKTNMQRIFDGIQRTKDKSMLQDKLKLVTSDTAEEKAEKKKKSRTRMDEIKDLNK